MKKWGAKKGFTLIELLVVIAIIALLLAILMPALKKAKELARNVICRTNIRSITTGFRMHVDSNHQKLIEYGSNGQHNLWLQQIEDQVGEIDKVRYCPATKLNPKAPPLTWPNGFGTAKYTWVWPYGITDNSGNDIAPGNVTSELGEHGAYAYNFYFFIFNGSTDYSNSGHWETPNPPNSSNVPVFADCIGFDIMPAGNGVTVPTNFNLDDPLAPGSGGSTNNITSYITNRHKASTNVGFIDGHVDSVKLEMLWSLKWGKDFKTLGPQTRVDGSPIYQRGK